MQNFFATGRFTIALALFAMPAALLAECQSTGCWQSRVAAPRRGFERR